MIERPIDIQATARENADVHCSYCRDVFSETITGAPCGSCGTRLHRSCWSELKSCPTTGCPGGWQGAVVVHDPSVTDHCASCGDGLLPRAGAPCSGCGVRLHRFCWDALPGCPRKDCDGGWTRELGSGSRPRVRARADAPEPSEGANHLPWAFGTQQWFHHWVDQDPLTRGLTLAPHMALWGLVVVGVFGGMAGAVYTDPRSSFSLMGMLSGAAWSIPAAAIAGAYGLLQGLIGVRRKRLKNGGMIAMTLATILGGVGVFATGSPTVGGITGGVIGALLGVRLFGVHFESDAS